MAVYPSAEPARHRSARLRGMGDLEGSVRDQPQHDSDHRRVRVYGALGTGGHNLHPLRSWLILGIVSPTAAVALTEVASLVAKGH